MEVYISALAFLTAALVVIGLYQSLTRDKVLLQKRLDKITEGIVEEIPGTGKFDAKAAFTIFLSSLGKGFTKIPITKKVERQLSKADILLRTEEFIGMNILTAIGGAGAGLIIFGPGPPAVVLGLIGLLTPALVVYRKQQARAVYLDSQIGESLDGMSNALRSGYSFQQAMDLVSKEIQGPLGVEFGRTLREITLGITTEQAMQNMIQRVGSEDLDLMISAVLIQRLIGGNLAEIFDNISNTIRERIRMKGEVKTLTAQARMSGLVIGLLPVFILIALLLISPSYINIMFASPVGWMMLGGAFTSEVIGFVLMRTISNIRF
jgi:tight adherence protein B